ncbi:MAG: NAD+ synthase [Candidatus Methylacidiphilales bacterium]|nr:NAD+ synthase [Candidatus Methylacidiphilales bacterium]
MKLGILQLNPTIGDYSGNLQKLRSAYLEACRRGADFVIAPELYLCGYPPRDLLLRDDFIDAGLKAVEDSALFAGPVPLAVGFVDRHESRPGRRLRNAAAIVQNGKVIHRVYKSLLPTYDVFDEDRYFEPAQDVSPIAIAGRKVGLTICEDIWNDADFWPERLYRFDPVQELVVAGADLIVNLSASPWHQGKAAMRLAMLQHVARDENVALAQVNAVGGNDELIFDGHSVLLAPGGHVIALASGFAEEIIVADIGAPAHPASAVHAGLSAVPKEEHLHDALCLGIRDYVQKTGFNGAIVGLSGGIDSAVVAALAAHALGPEKVIGVSMPSRYSSQGSKDDARKLAENLGIRYEVVPIGQPVAALEAELATIFAGRQPDLTEENIQSRMRGVILMALSNKLGSLVLTTGNKSEMAVGYCTLYGDMCGALAVIADLFKLEVYALARWMNRNKVVIPVDSITKPPSAELRPNQKDQDSLPPYEVLDAILQLYVVEDKSREEIIAKGFEPSIVRDVMNKVINNEYKRRQAAPGLKVSTRAFGMGRRVPIAQRYRG